MIKKTEINLAIGDVGLFMSLLFVEWLKSHMVLALLQIPLDL